MRVPTWLIPIAIEFARELYRVLRTGKVPVKLDEVLSQGTRSKLAKRAGRMKATAALGVDVSD